MPAHQDMSRQEHYDEAERLLVQVANARAAEAGRTDGVPAYLVRVRIGALANLIAEAQVHATLAAAFPRQ